MNHNPEKWFKHSIDSHNEPQMRRIKARFGKLNGYAMYYISIEIMMRSGGWIEHDDIETYADDYGVDCDELERFFSYCVSIEAFILVDNKYSADTVQETLEKRKRISEVRSEAGAIGGKAKAPAKAKEPKPVVKESFTPESDQITRLRGYAQAIFDELGSGKNKPELSNEQYQKLIDKWGFDKLVVLQRIYYEWKASLAKKHTHTDFGTLNKKCWVHEKADKDDGCQEQYESGNTPTPDQIPNPPAGDWPYPFPKPKGFNEMEHYAKRDLLSKLMNEYLAGKEAANPKPINAPEPLKEEVWKYDFPKPEHWDGMKQAAKDAYIARELMKEAQDVINSLPH